MLTIGHSNRPLDRFLDLLTAHGVERLVDIRTIPRSRYNPQFNKDALPESLRPIGIDYVHMPGLGGMRRPNADSINTGWRNPQFRGYADYMQTPEFRHNIDALLKLDRERRVAIMCAEALPWRCHRSLVSDALTARGIPVLHIMSAAHAEPHKMTAFGQIDGTIVKYPSETPSLFTSD